MPPPYFAGDAGVRWQFAVTGLDPQFLPQAVDLLVDGKVLACTVAAVPEYVTTGQENFSVGSLPAQLKLIYDPATSVLVTKFFTIDIEKPLPG